MTEMFTRNEVREAFNRELTYKDVAPNDIRALEGFLCIAYAHHVRNGGYLDMLPSYRKKSQPVINTATTGGIKNAFLRVDSSYWRDREAISFNRDGFIGFAGWADDGNVQPFLRAFMRWLEEWMGCNRVFEQAASNAAPPDADFAC